MATPPHKTLRILFVDDEKPLQEFMRSELPRLGHEVTVCPDGRAALKVLEKSTFDAAILEGTVCAKAPTCYAPICRLAQPKNCGHATCS